MSKLSRILIALALVGLSGAYLVARECAGGTRGYKIVGNDGSVNYIMCNAAGCNEVSKGTTDAFSCGF